MSLFRSMLQSSTSPRNISRAFELPLYSTDQPTIPRSLVDSIYPTTMTTTEDLRASTIRIQEVNRQPSELVELRRREGHLQQRLQRLLDAQADGLIAGPHGGSANEKITTDNGDRRSENITPTVQSVRRDSSSSRSARDEQGMYRNEDAKVGLGVARRQIWQTIRQLAAVKQEEDEFLGAEQAENERILDQIDEWECKRGDFQNQMRAIEDKEAGRNARVLQDDADKLGGEIRDLEIRLAQMKTRHRQMLGELAGIDNAVQSKLSAYRSSLSLMESEIETFLKTEPEREPERSIATSPFLLLPAKRRTLGMAREYWQDKLNDVERARKEGELEKDALDEGAIVWKEVATAVLDFESVLKSEISMLGQETDKEKQEERTRDLLGKVDGVLTIIDERFKLAEAREWKLLICSIGAELEAFKQGKTILESIVKPAAEAENGIEGEASHGRQTIRTRSPANRFSPDRSFPHRSSPSRSNRISSPRAAQKMLVANDSDDDPDPELLMSHQQDTDDEYEARYVASDVASHLS